MIQITQTMLEQANQYIPLATKAALAQAITQACMEKVKVGVSQKDAGVLPPRWQENVMTKHRALMGVFARYYLKIEWEGWEEDICMPLNLYDEYASSRVVSQVERMKPNDRIREKIYAILEDYRMFASMLNSEIHSQLGHLNDTAMRINAVLSLNTDPQQLQATLEKSQEILKMLGERHD